MTMAASQTEVRQQVTVAVPAEKAFAFFTERFDDWWPMSHHIGPGMPAARVIESPRITAPIAAIRMRSRWRRATRAMRESAPGGRARMASKFMKRRRSSWRAAASAAVTSPSTTSSVAPRPWMESRSKAQTK